MVTETQSPEKVGESPPSLDSSQTGTPTPTVTDGSQSMSRLVLTSMGKATLSAAGAVAGLLLLNVRENFFVACGALLVAGCMGALYHYLNKAVEAAIASQEVGQ